MQACVVARLSKYVENDDGKMVLSCLSINLMKKICIA